MRNWNDKACIAIIPPSIPSFYFTYEELKPFIVFTIHTLIESFYFTYEELKHDFTFFDFF